MNLKKNLFTILLASLVSLTFTACEKKEESKQNIKETKKEVSVDVHTIKRQKYPVWVDFTGKTEAFKNVEITSRVTGELKKIYFKAGDFVRKDQLLFTIDDSEYKAILAQKQATLNKDRASLKLAIANVKRYEPLVKKALAAKEKLDELVAKQEELRAIVNADLSAIKQAKLDVDYCQIKATIDGKIGKNLVDIGNIISNQTKLASIVQSKTLYVNFNPSDKEVFLYNKYKSEEFPKVKVLPEEIDDTNVALDGRVDFVDNVTNETTGTVAMRAKIDNSQNYLFPGTFVKIKLFITDQIPLIAVHPNNIQENQLGSFVYVVDKNNEVKTKQVVIDYSNSDLTLIKEGLEEGDKVIVSATKRLTNNQKVKAVEVANPIKL